MPPKRSHGDGGANPSTNASSQEGSVGKKRSYTSEHGPGSLTLEEGENLNRYKARLRRELPGQPLKVHQLYCEAAMAKYHTTVDNFRKARGGPSDSTEKLRLDSAKKTARSTMAAVYKDLREKAKEYDEDEAKALIRELDKMKDTIHADEAEEQRGQEEEGERLESEHTIDATASVRKRFLELHQLRWDIINSNEDCIDKNLCDRLTNRKKLLVKAIRYAEKRGRENAVQGGLESLWDCISGYKEVEEEMEKLKKIERHNTAEFVHQRDTSRRQLLGKNFFPPVPEKEQIPIPNMSSEDHYNE